MRPVKELAISFCAGAARLTGLAPLARHLTKSKIPILTYHNISTPDGGMPSCLDLTGMRVVPEEFRAQMRYVAEHYNTVTFEEVLSSRLGQSSLPPHPCMITFDDGYMDVYENALPVLQEFGLKATFFVIGRPTATGERPWLHAVHEILDTAPAWDCASAFRKAAPGFFSSKRTTKKALCDLVWRYFLEENRSNRQRFLDEVRGDLAVSAHAGYRLMEARHIRELYERGFEIGCHSMNHEYMPRLTSGELREDIRQCKEVMASHLGRPPNLFCYPFGAFDARLVEALKQEGFAYACTTRSGINDLSTNPHALYRNGVYSDTSFSLFVFQLVGLEAGLRKLYRFVRSAVGKEVV